MRELEIFAILLVLLGALFPLLLRLRRRSLRAWALPIAMIGIAVLLVRGVVWYLHASESHYEFSELVSQSPTPVQHDGYVGSAACKSCHPKEHASWHKTYHRTMTQLATPESILGAFDGVPRVVEGRKLVPKRRGNTFWVTMSSDLRERDADFTVEQEHQVVMTTGSHHYQRYWRHDKETGGLRPIPFAFLREEQRWVSREAALLSPPEGRQTNQHWNENCIRCHSTHSKPQWDARLGRMASTTVELGISCESCHGPGEAHIQSHQSAVKRYLNRRDPLTGPMAHLVDLNRRDPDTPPDPTIVHPGRLSAERSNQLCGQCHANATFPRRDVVHGHWNEYRPGDDLHQVFNVIQKNKPETHNDLLQQFGKDLEAYFVGWFWSDGMPRVTGREYNNLLETRCYTHGKQLSCLSCHSMHHYHDPEPASHGVDDQLAPEMAGNRACVQCHQEDKFGKAIQTHTHHAASSSGSLCYNCHMPHTSFGLLKAVRSHQIVSPSVAATVETGRPHACNICHLDKSLGWTQDKVHDWFGTAKVDLSQDDSEISAAALHALRGDAAQRALAAWAMGWNEARGASGEQWLAPYLARLIDDPYSGVRYVARRSLRRIAGYEAFDFDYVAETSDLILAREEAMSLFRGRADRLDRHGPSILLDGSGRLDEQRFGEIFKQRNDRMIDIHE